MSIERRIGKLEELIMGGTGEFDGWSTEQLRAFIGAETRELVGDGSIVLQDVARKEGLDLSISEIVEMSQSDASEENTSFDSNEP
jgi:hypothetical protein